MAPLVHAQTVASESDAQDRAKVDPQFNSSADNAAPGEIIVTAQKREQRLNDVGLTINAISSDALEKKGISSLEDVANAVPGLTYTPTVNGNPVYTLRGVGFYETSLGAYPTTSVYMDEVPMPFSVITKHSAFDLERIEVLKGPQGTLFGQNSTGGAINYIAAKPTSVFHAGGELSYGRFNEIEASAYVSGPITDTLSARISGRIEHGSGWQRSNSRPGDTLGKTRNYMGRILLNFEPSDRFKFAVNVNGWIDKSDTQAPQYIALFAQQPAFVDPGIAATPFSPLNNRAADWSPGVPFSDNNFWQASLRADIQLGDFATLTSISSYLEYNQRQGDDGDGLPERSLDQVHDDGYIRSFSQEVRVANQNPGALRWVLGANYSRDRTNQEINYNFPNASTHYAFVPNGYDINASYFTSYQAMRNYAGFANVEYDLTSSLTVKVGGRYTQANRYASECNSDRSGNPLGVGAFYYGVVLGGAFGAYQSPACFAVNFPLAGRPAETIGGVAPGSPGRFVDQLKEHNFSFRAGLDYKLRPGVLLYANVSKGYKAGSYPIVGASLTSQFLPVVQESVLAYEAGFKATLFDRLLQLNGAAFYYDYKNKQLRGKFVDPVNGVLDILQNIPKSSIKGAELEATLAPARGLTINGSVTYIDAKIDRFVGANVSGNNEDFAGTKIPFTPKWQAGANVDYETALTGDLNIFGGASINYRSSATAAIGGDTNPVGSTTAIGTIFRIKSYSLVDGHLGIEPVGARWQAKIWVKNLFDKYYWTNVVPGFDTIGRYTGRPRTFGATISFKM